MAVAGKKNGNLCLPEPLAKYHNYVGLNKSLYLYGEHMLKEGKPLIICEGQIDAIITWQALGIPTIASLGEGFSTNHVRTICSVCPTCVYIFMDNDAAGRISAEKVEYKLRGRLPVKVMLPPLNSDPGSMTTEQIQSAFDSAFSVYGEIDWPA